MKCSDCGFNNCAGVRREQYRRNGCWQFVKADGSLFQRPISSVGAPLGPWRPIRRFVPGMPCS